ncbi:Protein of uncharacterised function (DUF2466) [Klebsiella pneumoniae]|nr:Protein of uncharacterised function (DUF2466) [Klebsiella pneumoniae]
MKFSAEELNIIRQADAIIAGKITTTDFITGADAARSLLRFRLAAEPRESFCAFFLNCHNGVIAFEELFKGTISSVTVSSCNAPCIIMPPPWYWRITILPLTLHPARLTS